MNLLWRNPQGETGQSHFTHLEYLTTGQFRGKILPLHGPAPDDCPLAFLPGDLFEVITADSAEVKTLVEPGKNKNLC